MEFIVIYEDLAWIKLFLVLFLLYLSSYKAVSQLACWPDNRTALLSADAEQRCGENSDFIYADGR